MTALPRPYTSLAAAMRLSCAKIGAAALAVLLCAVLVLAGGVPSERPKSHFYNRGFQYRPACGAHWLANRVSGCKGRTTGEMPSIEDHAYLSWQPCCGSLGVPPPTYYGEDCARCM